MRLVQRFFVFSVLAVIAGCASAAPQRTATSADPNVILEAELSAYAAQPVSQAIQRLRPQFLRSRGASSINQTASGIVIVYLGATRMGGPEALAQIRTGDLTEVRYLSPSDASRRFGLNHTAGAIVLTPR